MKEPLLFKDMTKLGRVAQESLRVKANERAFSYQEVKNESGHSLYRFDVEDGAHLEAVIFQGVKSDAETFVKVEVNVARDAQVKLTVIQQGGNRSHVEIESIAKASGAEIEIRGLQNAKDQQKFSFNAHARHGVPHTKSDLQVWCIANQESHSIFNGVVTIEKGAHHTEAYQRNKNLLLSERATIDTFPKLFIGNDDVKCAHGSTVSQLEPEQFYYLQSRGIGPEDAELMLVRGFMHQALEWISNADTRSELEKKLQIEEEDFS